MYQKNYMSFLVQIHVLVLILLINTTRKLAIFIFSFKTNFCGKTRCFRSWRVQKFIFHGISENPMPPCLYAPHERFFTKDDFGPNPCFIYEKGDSSLG